MSKSTPPTWLITGTSSGLGLSLSKLVLRKGHNLISISRHPGPDPSLIALASSYRSTDTETAAAIAATPSPPTLHHIPLDLSTENQSHLKSTIHTFLTDHPNLTPTILINNAGVTTFSALETTSPDHLHHVMTTNFFSPLYLIQAVLPHMRGVHHASSPSPLTSESTDADTNSDSKERVIVNISSTQGLCTDAAEVAYDASKHALEAMSGVLAAEVATFGIRVMVVNLGSLRTGFARGGERAGLVSVSASNSTSADQQQDQNAELTNLSDDPYTSPTHPVTRRITNVNKLVDIPGLARGSPSKTASVLFDGIMKTKDTVVHDVLEGQRQRTLKEAAGSEIGRVERLVLGSDAQPKIERVLERLRGDVEGCRGVSGLVEADGEGEE